MFSAPQHRVVIVGGGFAGLNAARALRRAPVQVTLIDRRNFHLFQPLLYQVATGALSPANIAAPLRWILERQSNCGVLLGEVRDFDIAARYVLLDNSRLPYDTLIVVAGGRHSYFGHPEWEPYAPGLKTIEDATEIRRRIFTAFEMAEREAVVAQRRMLLTFVIVGGGPTGVEMAGAAAEIARHSLSHEFRHIDPSDAQILLIEAGDRVLGAYPPELSAKAQSALERLGVTVRTKNMVKSVTIDKVTVDWAGGREEIPTQTVIWAAGVQASPLAERLAAATGATLDRAGRLVVEPDLSLSGHPEIFVLGDMANYAHQDGKPLPGVAPVAIQQGRYVAKLIKSRLRNKKPPTFHYRDRGTLATIGRSAAVADFGKLRFSGFFAWFLWLIIHLMNLVSFRNRLLVFIQWGWNYVTYDRAARLITGETTATGPPPAVQTVDRDKAVPVRD
ncbi:MAG TPA: NAD(P)/FAD-dependent oxidoreductase [Lacipirellulaceae bacterium]|jgi:NADH dehydrogenase|nr:NAD(P)/FAD-dependent oxidoreductase [Lacipirellulaceae bacterium]